MQQPLVFGLYSKYVCLPANRTTTLAVDCGFTGLTDVEVTIRGEVDLNAKWNMMTRQQGKRSANGIFKTRGMHRLLLKASNVLPGSSSLELTVPTGQGYYLFQLFLDCRYVMAFDPLFGASVSTQAACNSGECSDSEKPDCLSLHQCVDRTEFGERGMLEPTTPGPQKEAPDGDNEGAFIVMLICLICFLPLCCKTCQKLFERRLLNSPAGGPDEGTSLTRGEIYNNSLMTMATGFMQVRREDNYLRRGGHADDDM